MRQLKILLVSKVMLIEFDLYYENKVKELEDKNIIVIPTSGGIEP